jgi:tetratricopeptide (TPR) repeat protein
MPCGLPILFRLPPPLTHGPKRRMRVAVPLLLLMLPACGSLSADDAKALSQYQSRAQTFWDGARFADDTPALKKKLEQCLDQAERGLAIDSDNYKLLTIKGMVKLRQSNIGGANSVRDLNEAEALFARVYLTRKPVRHQSDLLLGYSMALEAQGLRNLSEAKRLQDQAAKGISTEGELDKGKATEHDKIGRDKLLQARSVLAALETRGDLMRICYFHQMQVAAALNEKDETVALGEKYLKATDRAKKSLRDEIEKTTVLPYEKEQGENLRQMQREEIDVRAMLAEMHYLNKEFDKALIHLQEILKMDPSRKVDYFNRGRCLRELGRNEEAKADFRKFLATSDLPPGNPKMTEAVRALESQ